LSRLKELTHEIHERAERTAFAQRLLNGITPLEYYIYLANQYEIYSSLEKEFDFTGLELIKRSDKISADLHELETKYGIEAVTYKLCNVIEEYKSHIRTLTQDQLLAHVYVRYLGDMYGGQMIKRAVPGSGTMYDFENKQELKVALRERLHDGLANEATVCFEFAIKLFKELNNE